MYGLQERLELLLVRKKSNQEQLDTIISRIENLKATQYDRVMVSGSGRATTIDDLLDHKIVLDKELEWINEDLAILQNEIDNCENILKQFNDRNKLIYYYVRLKKMKPLHIALKYGLTEQHIRRVVREIEDDLKLLK